MTNQEKVIKDFEAYETYALNLPSITMISSDYLNVLAMLKERETVEHALDVLRKNGWKEEGTCEKCTLLTAVSDGVHDMAKQFRMGGETNG